MTVEREYLLSQAARTGTATNYSPLQEVSVWIQGFTGSVLFGTAVLALFTFFQTRRFQSAQIAALEAAKQFQEKQTQQQEKMQQIQVGVQEQLLKSQQNIQLLQEHQIEKEHIIHQREVIFELNRQYFYITFELRQKLEEICKIKEESEQQVCVREYYRRYFGHQYYQFMAWQEGLVPTETYKFWMRWQRAEYFREDNMFREKHYREGYAMMKEMFKEAIGRSFFDFLDIVFDKSYNSVDRAIDQFNSQTVR